MPERQIVAGSAGFPDSGRNAGQLRMGAVMRYALDCSGASRPRVCWLGTATGDGLVGLRGFYGAMAGEDVQASHLQLFSMPNVDPETHLLSQDVIWVGGGSVVNLLAVWRAHGLDRIMRSAWERGIVLGGVSAGAICWHTGGTTDSFGELRAVTDGLGLLPFSCGVHQDSEPGRRPLLARLIGSGVLADGYATDDGVAIHYLGTRAHAVLADTADRYAYSVSRDASGETRETRLTPTLLPGA